MTFIILFSLFLRYEKHRVIAGTDKVNHENKFHSQGNFKLNGFYYLTGVEHYSTEVRTSEFNYITYLTFYDDGSMLVCSYVTTKSLDPMIGRETIVAKFKEFPQKFNGIWGTYTHNGDSIYAKIFTEDPTVIPKRVPEYWTMLVKGDSIFLINRICTRCIENKGKRKKPFTVNYNPPEIYKFIEYSPKPDSSRAWFKPK
jgi:hypothetical protein